MDSWAKRIDAITLFVEDLAAAKAFYLEVFGLPIHFEDDNSAVFKFGETLINLLEGDRGTRADRARGRSTCGRRIPAPVHHRR